MLRPFIITHLYTDCHSVDVVLAESNPDFVDLALSDVLYEPIGELVHIDVKDIPNWLQAGLDIDRINTTFAPIIELANDEERQSYIDGLDEFETELLKRFTLRK